MTDFARTRQMLLGELGRLGWGPVAPADGAFYLYADLGEQLAAFTDSAAWSRALLDEAGVAVVPGGDFDAVAGTRFVRLCFAAGVTVVAEAVDRIVAFPERAQLIHRPRGAAAGPGRRADLTFASGTGAARRSGAAVN